MILNIILVILLLVPTALISGPFLPDFFISLSSLLFLFLIIKEKKIKFLINRFSIIFFSIYIYLVTLSFFSYDRYLSLESSLFYFRFGLFALCIVYLLENIKKINKYFFWCLFIPLFLVSFDSVYQLIFKINIIGYQVDPGKYQITGFFGDEKILGSYVLRLSPIFLAFFFIRFKDSIYSNLFLFFSIFLFLFVTFISGERTSFFMMLFSIILYTIFINGYRIYKALILLFLIPILSFIIFTSYKILSDKNYLQTHVLNNSLIPEVIKKSITRNIYQTISSMRQSPFKKIARDEDGDDIPETKTGDADEFNKNKTHIFSLQHELHYESAYKMFNSSKLFGHGPKLYRILCNNKEFEPAHIDIQRRELSQNNHNLVSVLHQCSTHPHHTYLQLLAETGIIGTIPIIFLFLFSVYILASGFIKRILPNYIPTENFNISIIISLVINFWPIMPSPNFFNNYMSVIYFLSIGLFLKKYIKYNNE